MDLYTEEQRLINECEDLDSLFKLWKCKQDKESEDSRRYTIPFNTNGTSKIPASNFLFDGFFCEDTTNAAYLYILKESNLETENAQEYRSESCDGALLWRREQINENLRGAKRQNTIIVRLFNKLPNCICDKSNLAVININKRGGYKTCDENALKAYGKKYGLFIKREVEIISPHLIICASTTFEVLKRILEIDSDSNISFSINKLGTHDCTVYHGPHPSCRNAYTRFENTIRALI